MAKRVDTPNFRSALKKPHCEKGIGLTTNQKNQQDAFRGMKPEDVYNDPRCSMVSKRR